MAPVPGVDHNNRRLIVRRTRGPVVLASLEARPTSPTEAAQVQVKPQVVPQQNEYFPIGNMCERAAITSFVTHLRLHGPFISHNSLIPVCLRDVRPSLPR